MKQSANYFGNKTKNQLNYKEGVPNNDRKITEPKESLSDRSEGSLGQNGGEAKNRGFSRPKANPLILPAASVPNSSWFTKVNQIHANGGTKFHNKENLEANKKLESEQAILSEQVHAGDSKDPKQKTTEKRIARFLDHISKKLKTYLKDNKDSIDDPKKSIHTFEEYIRGLDPEELEKFLSENEREYGPLPDSSENSAKEEGDIEAKDEAKSISSISEIPQEELILITNLEYSLTADTCDTSIKQAFGEWLDYNIHY